MNLKEPVYPAMAPVVQLQTAALQVGGTHGQATTSTLTHAMHQQDAASQAQGALQKAVRGNGLLVLVVLLALLPLLLVAIQMTWEMKTRTMSHLQRH